MVELGALLVLGGVVVYQAFSIRDLTKQLMARSIGEYNLLTDRQMEAVVMEPEPKKDEKYIEVVDADDIPDPIGRGARYEEIK
jgi:hypothetical protein